MRRPGLSGWGDETTRASLLLLADALRRTTSFEVVTISVIDDQGVCENVAVAGHEEAVADLLGTRIPLSLLSAPLAAAGGSGPLRLVLEQDNDLDPGWFWLPQRLADPDDETWHPLDWLAFEVRDDQDALVALIHLDLPADRRRPDAERLADLERGCFVARGAVVAACERERLAAQARLAETARNVVRGASGRLGVPTILSRCHEAILEGFRARSVFLQVLDEDGRARGGDVFTADGRRAEVSTALIDLAERDARIGWVEQRVAIIDEHHRQGAWLSAEEGDLVMPFLESRGLSSMLFVPIGVAETCLGSMALTRRPGDPPWSSAELETGLDIGHDLGHAIREARAHRREQELLTELREIDAYKSRLIATVSHELRNPLSAVSGHLEMIRATHDELPRDVERSLEAMERGTRRLGRTIADLLLYSEVGDPSRDFAPATVDLGRVVRDVRDLHEISARRHRQRVVVDVPPGEVPVRGVADDLDGVVSNLLSNALKYSPDGSTVTLIVRHDEREVTLLCCDEGVGVAEDEREAVFGEFFRSTDATVRREDGTGLGLAIVARIVRRHRGRVRVLPGTGRGTTFEVVLPSVREHARADTVEEESGRTHDGAAPA